MKTEVVIVILLSAAVVIAQTPIGGVTAPATGGATLSFVNAGSCLGATTSCAITYSPANGNLGRVLTICRDTTASQQATTATDNGTSTYANALNSTQQSSAYYFREDYTLSVAGSPTTITVHCGAATTATIGIIEEYHRTSGTWTFGATAAAAIGTANPAVGGSVTPTASVPAVIAGGFYNIFSSGAFTSSAPYTLSINQQDIANGASGAGSYQIVTSASGSYAPAATQASGGWYAWSAWYK